MPRDLRDVGVSSAITDADVAAMGGPAAEDRFIKEVAADLVGKLKTMVGGAQPRSEFLFKVTGPHAHPILGQHHVHTLAAKFDMAELPPTCDAYRLLQTQPDTDPGAHLVILPGEVT